MTKPKKYRKKPLIVEAIQWTGDNFEEIYEFTKGNCCLAVDTGKLIIRMLEGDMEAERGAFVIEGLTGEFYPCREEIFKETYEPVEE